ncbi:hypothetical protein JCM17823_19750 [Halorubrum gandharaense]
MATVYAVASAKGGVGKTTTTAALATLLAEAGADVVAVDADIGMANLAGALGVEVGETTVHDVLAGRAEPDEAVHDGPAGLRVLPGETDLDAYAEADPAGIRDVVAAFDDADYVFLDAGAGLSHDSTLPLALADETLLITTAERGALGDTEKTRELTERLGGTVAGAALTRVDPDAPASPLVDDLLDTTVIGRIPEDPAVPAAGAAGEPLVLHSPTTPATRAYRDLTHALTGHTIPRIDENEHPETDDGEVIEETASAAGAAGGTAADPTADDAELVDDEGDADAPESGTAETPDEDESGAEAADEDATEEESTDDILVADPEPAGVTEEGDDEDIIVAETEAVEDDEEEAEADETGGVTPDDAAAEEQTGTADDSDDELTDEETEADETGGVAPDDAAAEEPADSPDEAGDELTDEEAEADETGGVTSDDAAAEELESEPEPETEPESELEPESEEVPESEPEHDDTVPEAEPDRDPDDELAGSVPFRDDDTGTAMQSTIEEAEDEEKEDTEESKTDDDEKGGFFSRLFGR